LRSNFEPGGPGHAGVPRGSATGKRRGLMQGSPNAENVELLVTGMTSRPDQHPSSDKAHCRFCNKVEKGHDKRTCPLRNGNRFGVLVKTPDMWKRLMMSEDLCSLQPPPIQPQQNIHTSLLNKKDFRHVVVQEFYSATQLATTTGCPPPQEGSHPVVLARVKLLSMNLEEKDGVFFVTKDALAEWGKAKKKDTAITNQLCDLFIGAPLKTKMGFD